MNLTQLIYDITKVKPGHTQVFFRWEGVGYSRGYSRGYESIPHYDNYWPDTGMGYSPGYSNGYQNNVDYYGVNYIGAYSQGYSIGYDRHSGGGYSKGYSQGYQQPN